MEVSLITGRTMDQGCGKEHGKLSEEYRNGVAVCEMNSEDMRKLKTLEGSNVRVTTKFGSVVVKAVKSRRIRTQGVIFIAYGPWANLLFSPDTDGTGMPLLKGVQAQIEPTDERVPSLEEILIQSYGKQKGLRRD